MILITGAAGFIGFHLTMALLSQGDKVVGVDNLNDYYDPQLKLDRLKIISSHPKAESFTFMKLDIADRESMEALFSDFNFEVVVNLAAQAGVRYSLDNPHAYIDSNIVGFTNVLEGCRNYGVKHLVYASSSSVYGMNIKQPFSVTDRVDYPVSLYAATKKSNELMAHTYSHLFGIPVTGLRFFTVYGPYGRPDMAYYSFLTSIMSGEPIDVYNNGHMKRDFTYITDVVEGLLKVIKISPKAQSLETSNTAAPYQLYNIGNNNPESLNSFIEAIENSCGVKAVKNYKPMQLGDVPSTFADVDTLIADFDFKPEVELCEGISMFVDWFLQYHQTPAR